MTLLRSSAPVRIDFAGGWTDVAPFATTEGGLVVNAAITLRAHVAVQLGGESYSATADDIGLTISGASTAAMLPADALPLHRAALLRNAMPPCRIRSRSDAPPGSGLGTSGAMGVALQHALDLAQRRSRSAADTAELAWETETRDAAVAGGKQDQYAAALGGFLRLEFSAAGTQARQLALDPAFADELQRHLILCYTGQSRLSGNTITRVMTAFTQGDPVIAAALRAMAEIADTMTSALERGALGEVASLLSSNWIEQQRLDPGMCSPAMAELERAMANAGATGGKAVGSGAGGSMCFIVPGSIDRARLAAESLGAKVLPFQWSSDGMLPS